MNLVSRPAVLLNEGLHALRLGLLKSPGVMARDCASTGLSRGWRDDLDFASPWCRANPLEGHAFICWVAVELDAA